MKQENKNRKRIARNFVVLPPLGLLCVVLGACSDSNRARVLSGADSDGGASPLLKLQYDNGGTWEDVSEGGSFAVHIDYFSCPGSNIDMAFRLFNDGDANLTANSSPVISFSKSTNYSSPAFGSPADFTFAMLSQPTLPLNAGSSSAFGVRLANANNSSCDLGAHFPGGGGGVDYYEAVDLAISTNDPTHPTFNATINVLVTS